MNALSFHTNLSKALLEGIAGEFNFIYSSVDATAASFVSLYGR